jgi:hypothetical protein
MNTLAAGCRAASKSLRAVIGSFLLNIESNPTDPAMNEANAELSRVEVQANKWREIDTFTDS